MARRHGTNAAVVHAYANGQEYPDQNGTGTIYHHGRTIFSYGSHFPLAYKNDQGLYIINGDWYSVATASHQNLVQQALPASRSFTMSFNCAANAGIDYKRMVVIEHAQDQSQYSWQSGEPIDLDDVPQNATIRWETDKDTGERYIASWHLAASALIAYDDKHYLAGMDDDSYFISELPKFAENLEHAFDLLKPEIIKKVQARGLPVMRQGEWFCFPVVQDHKLARQFYKQMTSKIDIAQSYSDDSGNPHIATRAGFAHSFIYTTKMKQAIVKAEGQFFNPKALYFSGAITHPEHRPLRVSTVKKPEIWRLACNTAVNSWSVMGVD